MSYNIRKAMALLSLLAVMTACGDTQQQALLPNGSAAESAFTQKSSDTADSSMAISTEDAAVSLNATPDGLPVPPQVAEKLYGIAQTTGAVRVIVGFNAPPELPDGFMAEGTLGGATKRIRQQTRTRLPHSVPLSSGFRTGFWIGYPSRTKQSQRSSAPSLIWPWRSTRPTSRPC